MLSKFLYVKSCMNVWINGMLYFEASWIDQIVGVLEENDC